MNSRFAYVLRGGMMAAVVDELELELFALAYLNEFIGLSGIQDECERLLSNQEVALVFQFPIYYEELVNLSPRLAVLLFEDYALFEKILAKVLLTIIGTLKQFPNGIDANRLKVTPLFYTLPLRHHLTDFNDVSSLANETGYKLFKGKIISVSCVQKYTQHAYFYCSNSCCENSTNFKNLVFYQVGSKEVDFLKNKKQCAECKSDLLEDLNHRTLSDKVTIELISKDAFDLSQHPYKQALKFVIRGSLINLIQIGMDVEIIAIPISALTDGKVNLVFEANNVLQSVDHQTTNLSKEIHSLFYTNIYSPWSFVLDLAFYFAKHVLPEGTYFGLKLSVLLSLVNKKLNVMAIGQEVISINNLFTYSLALLSNTASGACIKHNPHLNDLFYSFKNDSNGLNYVQAGSLMLASNNGVCYLGNILSYSKKETQALKEVLESKKIVIQKKLRNMQQLNEPQLPIDYSKINCGVWAYYDSTYNGKDIEKDDVSLLPNSFLDLFGIVNFTNQINETIELQLLDAKLQEFKKPSPTQFWSVKSDIDDEQIKKLITLVANMPTQMSDDGEQLLRRYFIVLRRLNPEKMSIHVLPLLFNMSEAIAKLNFHKVVTEGDCTLAICIYQESFKNSTHETPLTSLRVNLQHVTQSEKNNISDQISLFSRNLKYLCDTYAPNFENASFNFTQINNRI